MTGAEWLASRDSWAMLQDIMGRASDRKIRLFAVGCCRQVWDSISTLRCRRAVETAERFADGLATFPRLVRDGELALKSVYNTERDRLREGRDWEYRLRLAVLTTESDGLEILHGLSALRLDFHLATMSPSLLRCVFGPHPDGRTAPDPAWRSPTAIDLARTMYDDRCFDTMPILGDALEEAGCGDERILGHCRAGGFHIRGCWVVDLILGRT